MKTFKDIKPGDYITVAGTLDAQNITNSEVISTRNYSSNGYAYIEITYKRYKESTVTQVFSVIETNTYTYDRGNRIFADKENAVHYIRHRIEALSKALEKVKTF